LESLLEIVGLEMTLAYTLGEWKREIVPDCWSCEAEATGAK